LKDLIKNMELKIKINSTIFSGETVHLIEQSFFCSLFYNLRAKNPFSIEKKAIQAYYNYRAKSSGA